jgi:hypothetical protein
MPRKETEVVRKTKYLSVVSRHETYEANCNGLLLLGCIAVVCGAVPGARIS